MDGVAIRSLRVRLVLPLAVVIAVVAVGTLGYHWLWRAAGGTWLDTLFMTVTTITTIGYAEIRQAEERGYLCMQGDATEDAVLERLGVRRARGLIATTANGAARLGVAVAKPISERPRLGFLSEWSAASGGIG